MTVKLDVWIRKPCTCTQYQGFLDSSVGRESACNAGDPSLIPGLGRSTEEGIGCLLQYSWASPVAQVVIYLQCGRPGSDPRVGKIPWRKEECYQINQENLKTTILGPRVCVKSLQSYLTLQP